MSGRPLTGGKLPAVRDAATETNFHELVLRGDKPSP